MFTLVSHKPHFQKQRFEIVREKPAWIYVSAQKKKKKYVFLCSFVPSAIHFSSTWAARATATQAPLDGTVCVLHAGQEAGSEASRGGAALQHDPSPLHSSVVIRS